MRTVECIGSPNPRCARDATTSSIASSSWLAVTPRLSRYSRSAADTPAAEEAEDDATLPAVAAVEDGGAGAGGGGGGCANAEGSRSDGAGEAAGATAALLRPRPLLLGWLLSSAASAAIVLDLGLRPRLAGAAAAAAAAEGGGGGGGGAAASAAAAEAVLLRGRPRRAGAGCSGSLSGLGSCFGRPRIAAARTLLRETGGAVIVLLLLMAAWQQSAAQTNGLACWPPQPRICALAWCKAAIEPALARWVYVCQAIRRERSACESARTVCVCSRSKIPASKNAVYAAQRLLH